MTGASRPAAAPSTRTDRLVYGATRAAIAGFGRTWLRMAVEGADRLPATGGFILSPVHRSNLDSILASTLTRRRMRTLGKESLWRYRLPGRYFEALGGFPVKRGHVDRDALRACTEVVAAGEGLVMFPEGTRRPGPRVEDLYDGPAFVSARTGVPIYPVGIGGTEAAMPKGARFVRRVPVNVLVGGPLWPEAVPPGGRVPRRVVRELTERLRVELQSLFDEARARSGVP